MTLLSDSQLPESNIHATTQPHFTCGIKGLKPLKNIFNANPLI